MIIRTFHCLGQEIEKWFLMTIYSDLKKGSKLSKTSINYQTKQNVLPRNGIFFLNSFLIHTELNRTHTHCCCDCASCKNRYRIQQQMDWSAIPEININVTWFFLNSDHKLIQNLRSVLTVKVLEWLACILGNLNPVNSFGLVFTQIKHVASASCHTLYMNKLPSI